MSRGACMKKKPSVVVQASCLRRGPAGNVPHRQAGNQQHKKQAGSLHHNLLVCGCCVLLLLAAGCGGPGRTGVDEKVTTVGSVEVTAQLEEIPGEFVDRANYDYGFVMKYKVLAVHRGQVDGDVIYVGHYNPQKPRPTVADARAPEVGGDVQRFRAGDVHRMALEVPIDDFFMGGIINRYFGQDTGPIYWAVWTNESSKP